MSAREWLQVIAEFRELWDRCDQLHDEEWMRLAPLFDNLQQSRSFQRTTHDRRQRLLNLWGRRETLSIREVGQLDRWIRLLLQDIELQELWSHRDRLSEPEWNRFCGLIYQALRANSGRFGSLLKALPEQMDDYIWDFISRKVFELGQAADAKIDTLFHTGTLWFYFRHYLLDRLDKEGRHRLPPPEPPADEQSTEFDLFEILKPEDVHPQWDELTKSMPDVDEVLKEAGLSREQVSREARTLIDALEPEDHILLKCGHCADGAEHLPVDRLKTIMPNPAYRAIKLRKRLKRWLDQALSIEPCPENDSVKLAALKILCWRALLDIETDCAALRARLNTADDRNTGATPSA